jgi:tRNA pseudouridine38-40 synthase
VHALGQVASVDVEGGPPAERAAEALNAVLPADLAVVAGEEAEREFHARHSARSRSYRYRIFRRPTPSPLEARRSWWHPKRIDETALGDSADLLLGEHDFRAFTPTDTQHAVLRRRVVEARWLDRGELLEFEITADSFLRRMVRTLVGTMVELPAADFGALLTGERDRSDAGTTAPPWGLYLERVQY